MTDSTACQRTRNYTTASTGDLAARFYDACEVRRLNPELWAEWEQTALYEAAHGRRFSIQLITEQARKKDRVNSAGEPVKLNNSHRAIWARMLATEHPEIRPFIELRKSYYDVDFPEAKVIGGTNA